jgi:hypothetical protein
MDHVELLAKLDAETREAAKRLEDLWFDVARAEAEVETLKRTCALVLQTVQEGKRKAKATDDPAPQPAATEENGKEPGRTRAARDAAERTARIPGHAERVAREEAEEGPAPMGGFRIVLRRTAEEHRLTAARYIAEHGPTRWGTFISACKIPQGTLGTVLKHEWFEHQADGYHLTTAGHQAVKAEDEED